MGDVVSITATTPISIDDHTALAGGGSGPHDPGMEQRMTSLEGAVGEIRSDLKNILRDIQRVSLDVAEIKGKVSNVPTTFQLIYMQIGFILAIFAASFALLKLALPHQG
jgi:hypothetical protein